MAAAGIVAPETRPLDVLKVQLQPWLQARMPEADGLRILDLSYPQGAGQSHETILMTVGWQQRSGDEERGMVLRIKPGRHTVYPDDLFDEQFRVMQVVHDHGLPVAEPLWLESDPTLLGSPFFVMERVAGRVPVSIPPYAETGWVLEATPAQRHRMWEDGVRKLAALRGIPVDRLRFLAGPAGEVGIEQEWGKYVRFVEWISSERRWSALDRAVARLDASRPRACPAALVWGDARLGNMMFDDKFDVAAIMDWEQPSLGGGLNDLAWWLVRSAAMHGATSDRAHLEGMGSREDTIALYRELTGVATDDLEWYEDFTLLKSTCLGIRLAVLRDQPAPDEGAMARRLKVG